MAAALEEHASLQSANATPEMDVITPIATVPVVNPTTPVYNPFPTTTPATATPASSSSSSGQSWCVASQTASQTALQVALDYACGYGGADCSAIQKGGSCFDPDTIRDHASYAFNDYYQRKPIPTSCDFAGTAIVTSVDPSKSPNTRNKQVLHLADSYLSPSDRYFDMPLSINKVSSSPLLRMQRQLEKKQLTLALFAFAAQAPLFSTQDILMGQTFMDHLFLPLQVAPSRSQTADRYSTSP